MWCDCEEIEYRIKKYLTNVLMFSDLLHFSRLYQDLISCVLLAFSFDRAPKPILANNPAIPQYVAHFKVG